MSDEKTTNYDLAPMRKSDKVLEGLGKQDKPIKIMFLKIPLSMKTIKGGLMKLRKFLGIGLLLTLLIVSYAPAQVEAGQAILSWTAPTTNEDGTPLTDLAGYKLYYSKPLAAIQLSCNFRMLQPIRLPFLTGNGTS